MKIRIIIPLALIGLFSVGSAYAMTNTQAKQLAKAAYFHDNSVDLTKLQSAAESGDAVAQAWLGKYWEYNVKFTKEFYWYKKAAAQGNVMAEYHLGNAYWYGARGLPQVYAMGAYWYKKAAVQGFAPAENAIANAYQLGDGVTQNSAKASYWWEKAAAQGDTHALNNLKIFE